METYREKRKLQNALSGLGAGILALFCLLSAGAEAGLVPFFTPAVPDEHWQSMWRGFISGAAFAILAMMLFDLVRGLRALRDEKALRKHYIKEHDERTIQVWTSARAAGMQAFLLLGLVATVICGYFSPLVSLTVLCCVLAASGLSAALKVYYSRKF